MNTNLRTSEEGRELIQEHETLRLKAYRCPAGVWTIGWGHTGDDVHEGMVITRPQAVALFNHDIGVCEEAIFRLVRARLNQAQFDALVSFTFNIGGAALAKSTLLRKLNAGEYDAVPFELARWNKAKGKVLPGLVRRRKDEAALWVSEDPDPEQEQVARPDPPAAKPMLASRTVQGGIASGAGVAGATLTETVQSLQPAADATPFEWMKAVFALLIVAGVLLTVWGRWRVMRDEGV